MYSNDIDLQQKEITTGKTIRSRSTYVVYMLTLDLDI